MLLVLVLIQLISAYDVYIVPHSHCDLGWLDTIDGYYNSHVGKILDNIVTVLQKDVRRKIVWSETSFLKQWINNSPKSKIDIFKRLVKDGQIEFVGGGYVQNDEANPDFDMVIRQINMGHEYLKQEFNVSRVQVAWQIDPFGYSALTPSIFSKFGYEYLVTNRIDVNFKEQLFKEKNIEFIWEGVNFGHNESILLHNLYDHYIFPDFFHHDNPRHCFTSDDLNQNLPDCTGRLYDLIERRKKAHRHDNLMILYGDDFYYVKEWDSEMKYRRIEAIREYMSKKYQNINIKIATASEYFEALKAQKIEFSTYKADLFPYVNQRSSGEPGIWTGYYTTRPHLKQKIFENNQLARAAEIAQSLSLGTNFYAWESSLTLHHDAITGTCRPHVADDYKNRLAFERKNEIRAIKDAIKGKFTEVNDSFALALPYRVVIVYNPLNWEKASLLSFEVDNGKFIQIKDWMGKIVVSQSVKNQMNDKKTVYIKLKLPALSFVTLFINDYTEKCPFCDSDSEQSTDNSISDKFFTINFDDSGLVESIVTSNITYQLSQTFWTYSGRSAGAYLFQPPDSGNQIKDMKLEKIVVSKGEVLETIEIIWKRSQKALNIDHYYQKIILYGEPRFIWKYGLYATNNDEILVRFSSNDINGDKWFLTSNSGDLRERKYYQESSSRKGYNMYPIPGGFAVKMKQSYLKFFPKFSVGVAMVDNSSFELLLHRKLQQDDGFGLGMGVSDDTFVHYHFEVDLGDLTHKSYMKSYLEAKTDVYSFTLANHNDITITDDIWSEGAILNFNWNKQRIYSLGFNSSDFYLSSVGMKNGKLFMRVLNLKDSHQSLHASGWKFSNKSLFNGNLNFSTYPYPYRANKEISFINRADTGMKKLLPKADEESDGETMMNPYEFAAYYVESVAADEQENENNTKSESDNIEESESGIKSEPEDRNQTNGSIENIEENSNSEEKDPGEDDHSESTGSKNQEGNKNETDKNQEEDFKNSPEEESRNSTDEHQSENKNEEINNENNKQIKENEERNMAGNETHYIIVNISDADEEKLDGSQIIEFCILFGVSIVFLASIIIYIRRKKPRIIRVI
ncbi:MAN2A2_1 [Blepharisma stoltei]|uniref:Alpha-mannosidase n=1 Tax=Blepharisma stoltei TaxID=1481888 RepID=A0AAU9IET8_9CILI|nr:unnamed protein product [Blepharisma stoltei]